MKTLHECKQERNRAIQELYNQIRRSQVNKNLLTRNVIISTILEQPAPRFYILPYQAKVLILRYYNNGCKIPENTKPNKREMIQDLIANYERLRNQFPHTPKEKIYEMVVEQPAKSFYMTFARVQDVVFNYSLYRRTKYRIKE